MSFNYELLSTSKSYIKIYYESMQQLRQMQAEEIAKIVWHPSRMYIWPEDPLIDDSDDEIDQNPENTQNIYINSTIRNIKMSIRLRS